jgi:lysozyme family protein
LKFIDAAKNEMKLEGGISDADDAWDKGGRTGTGGILQTEYDTFRISVGQPIQDVYLIDEIEILEVLWRNYWAPLWCPSLSDPLDFVLFQFGHNCGNGTAVKAAQRALGIIDDGVMGPVTRGRIRQTEPASLCFLVLDRQAERYDAIVVKDPTQVIFLKGWKNRIRRVAEMARLTGYKLPDERG